MLVTASASIALAPWAITASARSRSSALRSTSISRTRALASNVCRSVTSIGKSRLGGRARQLPDAGSGSSPTVSSSAAIGVPPSALRQVAITTSWRSPGTTIKPALGEDPQSTRHRLREDRHRLDPPGHVPLGQHPDVHLAGQIGDSRMGQLGVERHRAEQRQRMPLERRRSAAARDPSSSGTRVTMQPTTRPCSPLLYVDALIARPSAMCSQTSCQSAS